MADTDEQLSAYLDRALPDDEMRAVEKRLAEDSALGKRLEAFRAADRMVAARMADVLAEPVPFALAQAVARAAKATPGQGAAGVRAGRRGFALGALSGALAGVAATLAILSFAPPQPPPRTWTDDVASYHRIYAQETAHLVEVGAERAEHIRAWLGRRIGRDLPIPDLTAFGLTFRGARLLAAADAPVAQLVYTDAAGGVFALCLTPRPGAADAPPSPLHFGDLEAVLWRDGGTAILVIGPAGVLPLARVADSVAAIL
jgi:anti-sigma factor RsiW